MSGMFGGNTPTPPVVPSVQYPDTSGAAQNAFSGIGGLGSFSLGGQTLPQILGFGQSTANAVGGAPGQTAMNTANMLAPLLTGVGGMGIGAGALGINAGEGLVGAAQGVLPNIQQLLTTAFDPQSALYNRTESQVANQAGSQLANSGVAQTPYGQSVLGGTLGNFNIDWQNNLLSRMMGGLGSAVSGLSGLGSTIGQGIGTAGEGVNVAQAGGGLASGGSMLPFTTLAGLNQTGAEGLTGAIGAGNTAAQVPQTAIGDWLNYLSGAQGSVNSQNQANLNAAEFTAQQQQQQFQNIASAIGGLGSSLGGLFGAGGLFGSGLQGGAFGPSGVFGRSLFSGGTG